MSLSQEDGKYLWVRTTDSEQALGRPGNLIARISIPSSTGLWAVSPTEIIADRDDSMLWWVDWCVSKNISAQIIETRGTYHSSDNIPKAAGRQDTLILRGCETDAESQ